MTGELKEVSEEITKMDLRTPEKRDEVRTALLSLMRSHAWQLLKAYFEGEKLRLMGNLKSFTKPEDVQRWIGELKQTDAMLEWPEMIVKQIATMNHQDELRKQRKEGKTQ